MQAVICPMCLAREITSEIQLMGRSISDYTRNILSILTQLGPPSLCAYLQVCIMKSSASRFGLREA